MNQKSITGLVVLIIGFFLFQNLRKGSVEGSSEVIPDKVIPDEVIPERPSSTPLEKPIQKPLVIIPQVVKRLEKPRYVDPSLITKEEYIPPFPNPEEEYYSSVEGEMLPDRDKMGRVEGMMDYLWGKGSETATSTASKPAPPQAPKPPVFIKRLSNVNGESLTPVRVKGLGGSGLADI